MTRRIKDRLVNSDNSLMRELVESWHEPTFEKFTIPVNFLFEPELPSVLKDTLIRNLLSDEDDFWSEFNDR